MKVGFPLLEHGFERRLVPLSWREGEHHRSAAGRLQRATVPIQKHLFRPGTGCSAHQDQDLTSSHRSGCYRFCLDKFLTQDGSDEQNCCSLQP